MIKNEKGFVIIPLVMLVLLFMLTIVLFISSKQQKSIEIQKGLDESLYSEVENSRNDLYIKIKEGKKITNPKLEVLGQEKYDDGSINEYNVLENVLDPANNDDNINKIQFLDRVITQRRKSLGLFNSKEAPDKANNVFELDLTNFLDVNNVNGTLESLTLNYGTSNENRPDVYVLLGRIKKNTTFTLDDGYEERLTNKPLGSSPGSYGLADTTIDSFSFDYKKIDGGLGGCTVQDKDIDIKWCKNVIIRDFLSNTSFNLDNYFYRLFLVFGTETNDNYGVPFKLSAPNGYFGVGNLNYGDLTILTPNNTKRRFVIEASSKNSSLPYLVYSLWVKGEVQLGNGE